MKQDTALDPASSSLRLGTLILLPVLLFLILLMWLSTGWQTGYESDAWFFFLNGQRIASFGVLSRPFLPLSYVAGYWLAPGTLTGFNLMLALLLFGRSLTVFILAHQWRAPLPVAFGAAILTLLWPSDSGAYYLGALNVYFPGLLALVALVLMNQYYANRRLITLVGMWLAIIFSLGSYEANAPLIFAAPLFLILRGARWNRDFRRFLFRWYVFPVLWIICYGAVALASRGSLSYQTSLLEAHSLVSVAEALVNTLVRNLLPVWVGEYGSQNSQAVLFAVFGGLVVLSSAAYIARQAPGLTQGSARDLWLLAISGVLIILLSVVIFIPSSLIHTTIRTYFVATAGGMLALVSLIALVLRPLNKRSAQFTTSVFCLVIAGLAAVALNASIQQHAQFAARSEAQQSMVYRFASAFPEIEPGTQVVVVDQSPGASLIAQMDSPWHFPYAFYVGIGKSRETMPMAACSPEQITTDLDYARTRRDVCYFSPQRVVVNIADRSHIDSNGTDLLLIGYDASGFHVIDNPEPVTGVTLANYAPEQRFNPSAPLPEPLFTLFGFARP